MQPWKNPVPATNNRKGTTDDTEDTDGIIILMRHLHFTQSLEPLQGGGLGRAALDLHLQLLHDGLVSRLVATRSPDFDRVWPETFQYPRTGPAKAYFARSLGREAHVLLAEVDVVHGHGFYVYPNWAMGSRARFTSQTFGLSPAGHV